MKIIRRIVVGVDFSLYSPHILEYAAGIAERKSAEIIAVNVINRRQIEYLEKAINQEHPQMFSLEKFITDETRRRTQNLIDLIEKSVSKQVPTRTIIKSGVPFEEILKVMGRGIIVAGAMGAHSGNIPNGDFSIGLSPGLYVENGEVVGIHVGQVILAVGQATFEFRNVGSCLEFDAVSRIGRESLEDRRPQARQP